MVSARRKQLIAEEESRGMNAQLAGMRAGWKSAANDLKRWHATATEDMKGKFKAVAKFASPSKQIAVHDVNDMFAWKLR